MKKHHSVTQLRNERGRFTQAQEQILAAKKRALAALQEFPREVKFGGDHRTSQIYSRGFEFAFMKLMEGTWHQVCTFVYCKDFLHDAVWAWINKTRWSIWGFSYDSQKHLPLEADHCVMAFRNLVYSGAKAEEFHQQREACQEFLNGIEAQMGLVPSQVFPVEHSDGPCWLVVGDKGWQHAPPLVGLYTLFIRVGFFHTLGETFETTLQKAKDGKIQIGDDGRYAGNRDTNYIRSAWPGIEIILQHGLDVFHPEMKDNYPQDLPQKCGNLHDNLGPVNFTAGRARRAMPRWYKYFPE
jgi:hypothetical protein